MGAQKNERWSPRRNKAEQTRKPDVKLREARVGEKWHANRASSHEAHGGGKR